MSIAEFRTRVLRAVGDPLPRCPRRRIGRGDVAREEGRNGPAGNLIRARHAHAREGVVVVVVVFLVGVIAAIVGWWRGEGRAVVRGGCGEGRRGVGSRHCGGGCVCVCREEGGRGVRSSSSRSRTGQVDLDCWRCSLVAVVVSVSAANWSLTCWTWQMGHGDLGGATEGGDIAVIQWRRGVEAS